MAPPGSQNRTAAPVSGSRSKICSISFMVVPNIGSPPMAMFRLTPSPSLLSIQDVSALIPPLREMMLTLPSEKILSGLSPPIGPSFSLRLGLMSPTVLGPTIRDPFDCALAIISMVSFCGTLSVTMRINGMTASTASRHASLTNGGET